MIENVGRFLAAGEGPESAVFSVKPQGKVPPAFFWELVVTSNVACAIAAWRVGLDSLRLLPSAFFGVGYLLPLTVVVVALGARWLLRRKPIAPMWAWHLYWFVLASGWSHVLIAAYLTKSL